jgi:hypothetical protein
MSTKKEFQFDLVTVPENSILVIRAAEEYWPAISEACASFDAPGLTGTPVILLRPEESLSVMSRERLQKILDSLDLCTTKT